MPSIAIGTSDDNRSARRLRIAGVLIPLISTGWAESFMAAFWETTRGIAKPICRRRSQKVVASLGPIASIALLLSQRGQWLDACGPAGWNVGGQD